MYRTIGLSCLFLFAWLVVSAQGDTRIQVHMDANVKICVGEKIVLTCPDSIPARKVLTYEWFELAANLKTPSGHKALSPPAAVQV